MRRPVILAAILLAGVVALALLPFGRRDEADEGPTVLAAASLTDALERAGAAFERQGGAPVAMDFGSSGALRMKLLRGARADVYCPASTRDMDLLAEAGKLLDSTRRNVVRNRLVCVVPAASKLNLPQPGDLRQPAVRRVALADPAHAPAGRYAEQALRALGLWDALAGRRVTCDNVRAALAHAEAGSVEAAIVYRSDARISDRVKEAFAFPADSHDPIVYPVAVLKDAPHAAEARAFVRFLATPGMAEVFASCGFEPIGREAR
ncbi:MAG TPA: molybdate ABC transporter substrate-binding protein [Phycisphaerae bacterium]|nr:molybdate ABC transporter substrate-binding protein [Phycisphaerae bacterium]